MNGHPSWKTSAPTIAVTLTILTALHVKPACRLMFGLGKAPTFSAASKTATLVSTSGRAFKNTSGQVCRPLSTVPSAEAVTLTCDVQVTSIQQQYLGETPQFALVFMDQCGECPSVSCVACMHWHGPTEILLEARASGKISRSY